MVVIIMGIWVPSCQVGVSYSNNTQTSGVGYGVSGGQSRGYYEGSGVSGSYYYGYLGSIVSGRYFSLYTNS